MRTLNRPMFRYGGPIKQGVMNGIREPKKNGGKMLLVGQHPKEFRASDGREKHLVPLVYYGGMAALRALAPRAIAAGAKALGRGLATSPGAGTSVFGKGLTKMQRLKNLLPSQRFRSTIKPSVSINKTTGQVIEKGVPGKLSIGETLRSPELIGRAIRENPFTAFGVAGQVKNIPDALVGASEIIKSGAQGGVNYLLGTEFGRGDDKNTEGAVLEKLTTESIKEVLTPEEEKALAASKKATAEAAKIASASFAKAEKEKRIESYREIMDIKGMNRDATYKSLVDASKIIQEGGNLKEQLKSGSLIQKVTEAASKRFDKVNDTEAALRSLVVKGEIDNELNKEAKALAKKKDELAITAYEKQIKGKSIQEIRNERLMTKGELIEGNELASLIRGKSNGKISPKVLPVTGFKVGQDPIEFATNIIMKQNDDETTPDYPEGTYIIKDRIIYVDANGGITPVNDLSGI